MYLVGTILYLTPTACEARGFGPMGFGPMVVRLVHKRPDAYTLEDSTGRLLGCWHEDLTATAPTDLATTDRPTSRPCRACLATAPVHPNYGPHHRGTLPTCQTCRHNTDLRAAVECDVARYTPNTDR